MQTCLSTSDPRVNFLTLESELDFNEEETSLGIEQHDDEFWEKYEEDEL